MMRDSSILYLFPLCLMTGSAKATKLYIAARMLQS